ncbi:MAG: hypothetical protein E6Q40_09675 [Cupriavidus sp.]|nr:MAG: hypothetical protein E6Q40_09675 [Cupriavidus sp.]
MKRISTHQHPQNARPDIRHAAILAAPLWASGLVFFSVLFAISRHGEFFSLQFLAVSVAVVVGSTVAALRVMDRDLRLARLPQSPESRRMKIRARRLHSTH